ncbi:hypothetical protein V8C86DRAFT_2015, partial [Haematococcus lacustris]
NSIIPLPDVCPLPHICHTLAPHPGSTHVTPLLHTCHTLAPHFTPLLHICHTLAPPPCGPAPSTAAGMALRKKQVLTQQFHHRLPGPRRVLEQLVQGSQRVALAVLPLPLSQPPQPLSRHAHTTRHEHSAVSLPLPLLTSMPCAWLATALHPCLLLLLLLLGAVHVQGGGGVDAAALWHHPHPSQQVTDPAEWLEQGVQLLRVHQGPHAVLVHQREQGGAGDLHAGVVAQAQQAAGGWGGGAELSLQVSWLVWLGAQLLDQGRAPGSHGAGVGQVIEHEQGGLHAPVAQEGRGQGQRVWAARLCSVGQLQALVWTQELLLRRLLLLVRLLLLLVLQVLQVLVLQVLELLLLFVEMVVQVLLVRHAVDAGGGCGR